MILKVVRLDPKQGGKSVNIIINKVREIQLDNDRNLIVTYLSGKTAEYTEKQYYTLECFDAMHEVMWS